MPLQWGLNGSRLLENDFHLLGKSIPIDIGISHNMTTEHGNI